jgi:flagellar motor switch protein FliM
MSKLSTHRNLASLQRDLSPEEAEGLHENLSRVALTVRGVLAEVPLTIGDLLSLQPGHIVSLGRPASAPAIVEIEGVPRFVGRAGTVNHRRALRLMSVVPKGETIRDAAQLAVRARVHAS